MNTLAQATTMLPEAERLLNELEAGSHELLANAQEIGLTAQIELLTNRIVQIADLRRMFTTASAILRFAAIAREIPTTPQESTANQSDSVPTDSDSGSESGSSSEYTSGSDYKPWLRRMQLEMVSPLLPGSESEADSEADSDSGPEFRAWPTDGIRFEFFRARKEFAPAFSRRDRFTIPRAARTRIEHESSNSDSDSELDEGRPVHRTARRAAMKIIRVGNKPGSGSDSGTGIQFGFMHRVTQDTSESE